MRFPPLISANDYKQLQTALDEGRCICMDRTYADIQMSVETVPASKAWPVPILVRVRWRRGGQSAVKNCGSIEEMRWYLSTVQI